MERPREGCFVSGRRLPRVRAVAGSPAGRRTETSTTTTDVEFDIVIMDDPGHPSAAGMNDNGFPVPQDRPGAPGIVRTRRCIRCEADSFHSAHSVEALWPSDRLKERNGWAH